MHEQDHGQYRFFTAQDLLSLHEPLGNDPTWPERRKGHMEHMFTRRKLFVELFDAWGIARNLTGHKILEAHGGF